VRLCRGIPRAGFPSSCVPVPAGPNVAAPSTKTVPDSVVARGAENASQVAAQSSQTTPASNGPAKASAGVGGGGAGAGPTQGD